MIKLMRSYIYSIKEQGQSGSQEEESTPKVSAWNEIYRAWSLWKARMSNKKFQTWWELTEEEMDQEGKTCLAQVMRLH